MKRGSEKVLRQFRRNSHGFQMDVCVCIQVEKGSLGMYISDMQKWGKTF